jgi:hypothetical protein
LFHDVPPKVFLDIFDKHQHEGRVILPLLKTIEILMNRLCIKSLIKDKTFSLDLLKRLKEETKNCSDVPLLTAILNVATGIIVSIKTSPEAMTFVGELLVHEFPRIRSLTAEKLYVRLLETDPELGDGNAGIRLLLDHSWEFDGGENQSVNEMALQVFKAFDIDAQFHPEEANTCSGEM